MDFDEHLLTCLAEECAEVQQAVSKALRFGLDDIGPSNNQSNACDIVEEFIQVVAVIEMLEDHGILDLKCVDGDRVHAKKKERVLEFMEYAQENGTLHPPKNWLVKKD